MLLYLQKVEWEVRVHDLSRVWARVWKCVLCFIKNEMHMYWITHSTYFIQTSKGGTADHFTDNPFAAKTIQISLWVFAHWLLPNLHWSWLEGKKERGRVSVENWERDEKIKLVEGEMSVMKKRRGKQKRRSEEEKLKRWGWALQGERKGDG